MNTYSLSKLLNGHLYLTSLACHCCVNNKEIMVFKKEDEVLIKVLRQEKGYSIYV